MALLGVRILGFISFIALPQVLGFLSASHTRKFAKSYYPTLKKPSWDPPRELFKPIWKLMYLLMGIASYLVWRQKIINNIPVKAPIFLYLLQLAFNVNWAPLFFRVKSPILALFTITANLVVATISTILFYDISPNAAKLMLPYLAFLFFSGYLNKCVWRMNQAEKPDQKSITKTTEKIEEEVEEDFEEAEEGKDEVDEKKEIKKSKPLKLSKAKTSY